MTSRRWIKPPRVYEDTRPRSHNTSKITKIVQSIGISFRRRGQGYSFSGLRREGTGAGPPVQVFSQPAPLSLLMQRCRVLRIASMRTTLVSPDVHSGGQPGSRGYVLPG